MAKNKDIQKVRLVVRKGEDILVLLKNNSDEKYSLIGGHVDTGEERKEALVREAYEEVRMKIEEDELILLNEIEGKKVWKYYYLLIDNSKSFKLNESHKFLDCIWVNVKEAVKEMEKSDREIILFHILDEV